MKHRKNLILSVLFAFATCMSFAQPKRWNCIELGNCSRIVVDKIYYKKTRADLNQVKEKLSNEQYDNLSV